jgi:hypothetical protein
MVRTTDRPLPPDGEAAPPPSGNGDSTAGPAPSDTLQSFTLDDLAQYTREEAFGPTASPDFRVFYVGRDDVHRVVLAFLR